VAPPSAESNIARAFKDAGFWTLVAFGLFLPLIGFRAVQDIRNELTLETRWPLLFGFVAIVAVGRLFHNLVIAPWREQRSRRVAARRTRFKITAISSMPARRRPWAANSVHGI